MSRRQKRKWGVVDIVIPVHNAWDYLYECLEAIPDACGEYRYKVILVDNGSNKEDADRFYSSVAGAKVIRYRENRGFPYACNQGARQGVFDYILFLNSDCIMQPLSIQNMVDRFKQDEEGDLGVVGAKLLFPENPGEVDWGNHGKVQHVGMATNINSQFFHVLLGWSPDNPRVLAVDRVIAVTGAALMTPRSLFQKLGGFDEAFSPGSYEDVDYCFRVQSGNMNCVIEQTAVGKHYVGATSKTQGIGFPLERNHSLFLRKWEGKIPWSEHVHW